MVTKLRSSKVLRFIAICLFAISVVCGYVVVSSNYFSSYKDTNNFYETNGFQRIITNNQEYILKNFELYNGKSSKIPGEDINGQDLVSEGEVKNKQNEISKHYKETLTGIESEYNNQSQYIESQYKDNVDNAKENDSKEADIIKLKEKQIEEATKLKEAQIRDSLRKKEGEIEDAKSSIVKTEKEIKDEIAEDKIREYKKNSILIENNQNLKYIVIDNNDRIGSNIKEEYSLELIDRLKKDSEFYIIIRNGEDIHRNTECSYSDKIYENLKSNNNSFFNDIRNKKIKLAAYFVPKDYLVNDYIYGEKKEYDTIKANANIYFNLGKICLGIMLISIFCLIMSKFHDKSKIERLYNKIWIELSIAIQGIGLISGFFLIMLIFMSKGALRNYYEALVLVGVYIIIEYYLLVFGFHAIKEGINKEQMKQKSIIYKLIIVIKSKLKDVLLVKSTGFKFIAFMIATIIFFLFSLLLAARDIKMAFILFLYGLIYFGILIMYGFKFTKHLNKIIDGTSKIGEGDLNHVLDEKGVRILSKLAKNINGLKVGLKDALGKEMKSERMKSELITNVSHDLKTPLTSIINYVDLLKKEELTPEKANDYVEILDRKSQRLKSLIEDLFEASKATSGAMEMNIEKIEITELLNQTLAEFEEKIVDSKLDFKVNIGTEKVYVMGDGRRTYRVFENLIQNILKYSLANTRVYIDLVETKSQIRLSMKNISAYEMNFNSDEIAERFKRGDLSRNTEGSGLGLAIAKSIMELQNGKLELEIDGDLFKSVILFNK